MQGTASAPTPIGTQRKGIEVNEQQSSLRTPREHPVPCARCQQNTYAADAWCPGCQANRNAETELFAQGYTPERARQIIARLVQAGAAR